MPNDFTFIDNGSKKLALFEGFFDFLTFMQLLHKPASEKLNYLILNSTSFFEKSLPILQAHNHVYGYGQNDPSGNKITTKAVEALKNKFSDERSLYKNYKDLNEWSVDFGLTQKQGNRHHL